MEGKIMEFITMSNNIGECWYKKFGRDTHKDYLTVNYMKHKVPKYYDRLLDKIDPGRMEEIKQSRIMAAKETTTTAQENRQRATVKKNQIKHLNRSI